MVRCITFGQVSNYKLLPRLAKASWDKLFGELGSFIRTALGPRTSTGYTYLQKYQKLFYAIVWQNSGA